MGTIPADATHWDSGDWIDWHRHVATPPGDTCAAPSEDTAARLHMLHMRLLQSARAYFELTGTHLPVYDGIARLHAAIAFDLPLRGPLCCDGSADPAQVIAIAPHGPHNIVSVDLSAPFCCLIVVRIKDNFTSEARMVPRHALPESGEGSIDLCWRDLPRPR
ncbi:hypothetical protein [Roseobacter sp.]|uniref:hypothetical protein n=1 Tax=Roseobacter sp. TaxID=1907202 RepID=UPI0029662A56|nr:hypothetical protein [Roseobacter sp.]MDW3184533.1 hypothetical protein [Roseobacter sp.]